MLFLSKGKDITSWRAAADFNTRYRELLLARTASCRSEEAVVSLQEAGDNIRRLVEGHERCRSEVTRIIGEMETAGNVALVSRLSRDGFTLAYEHFGMFRSPIAFYSLSGELLSAVCAALSRLAEQQMGLLARRLHPGRCLVALGPAGRHEYSPYCPLQLLSLHGSDAHASSDAFAQFSRILHENLLSCGFVADSTVTPLHPGWRGDSDEWHRRIADSLEAASPELMIEVSRLCDQAPLIPADSESLSRFREMSLGLLRDDRSVLANLASRLQGLSNGLGLMGRLRTEKEGRGGRACFGLREHGLIPLSATVSTAILAIGGEAIETAQRIRELLDRRVLDVEMTERVLAAWHTLHELRLAHEGELYCGGEGSAHHLPIDSLTASQLEELRNSLETIGIFQRQALAAIALTGE